MQTARMMLFVSFLLAGNVVIGVAATTRGATSTLQARTLSEKEIVDIYQFKGLHAAAVASGGGFSHPVKTDFAASCSLEENVKHSAAVVVGEALANECVIHKQPSGLEILETVYDFRVDESIKGSIVAGTVVKIALPGGRYEWPDGTWAELYPRVGTRMVNGKRYVLLLEEGEMRPGVFVGYNGPQSIFELAGDGTKVTSFARPGLDEVVDEVKNKSVATFLSLVRTYAARWPKQEP